MKFALHLCFAMQAAFAIAGSAAAQEPLKDTPFYPLKLGSAWHYKGGNQAIKVTVTRHEPIGRLTCAALEWSVDGKIVSLEHVAATADGIYRCAYERSEVVPPLRFLKLPPLAGDTWKVSSVIDGVTTAGTFRVRREDVTVPLRRLNAFVASTTDTLINGTVPVATTYWFASGYGMVKQSTKLNNNESMFELVKFEPAR